MSKFSKILSKRKPRIAVAIMAAGKGTRLKSNLPKVLHPVGGKPLLAHVIASAMKIVPPGDIFVIVGHEAERVRAAVEGTGVSFVLQEEQRGTGHALMMAQVSLAEYDTVIVLSGDAPLITPGTIQKLLDFHSAKSRAMTILSARLENPTGYGRVLRESKNPANVKAIVEEKSATTEQRAIQEINSGFYVFNSKALFGNLNRLKTDNAHAEYYLTDMASILAKANHGVVAIEAGDASEILGANTRGELADIDIRMRRLKAQSLMAAGVTIFFPDTCIIDNDVEAGMDIVIEPFVQIRGKTRIGNDCHVQSYSVIEDSEIGDGVVIRPGCIVRQATVKQKAVLGPFSHLRPGSEIGDGAHVGNFVETKNIRLGKGSKANHLTYLGDARIGENVNIGAGTITCNYDGKTKNMTIIEDGVFVGSNSTLVAPLTVGKDAYIAAGSCLTENVPTGSLAIGRSRQIVKEGWVKEKNKKRHKNEPSA